MLSNLSTNEDFKREIAPRYQNITQANMNTRAKMAPALFVNQKMFRKAVEVAGDTIYNIKLNEI